MVFPRIKTIISLDGKIQHNPTAKRRIDIVRELQDVAYKLLGSLRKLANKQNLKTDLCKKISDFLDIPVKSSQHSFIERKKEQSETQQDPISKIQQVATEQAAKISEITRAEDPETLALKQILLQTEIKIKQAEASLKIQEIENLKANRELKKFKQEQMMKTAQIKQQILQAQADSLTAKADLDKVIRIDTIMRSKMNSLKETKSVLKDTSYHTIEAKALIKSLEESYISTWKSSVDSSDFDKNVSIMKDLHELEKQKQEEDFGRHTVEKNKAIIDEKMHKLANQRVYSNKRDNYNKNFPQLRDNPKASNKLVSKEATKPSKKRGYSPIPAQTEKPDKFVPSSNQEQLKETQAHQIVPYAQLKEEFSNKALQLTPTEVLSQQKDNRDRAANLQILKFFG